MGVVFGDLFDGGASGSSEVCRRLPNISISATSTPEQISSAIQRLEARCVRLLKLKSDAERLTEDDEDLEDVVGSKRQALVAELTGSIKSIEADIVRRLCLFLFYCVVGLRELTPVCVFGDDFRLF
jgi:hypothetical protein